MTDSTSDDDLDYDPKKEREKLMSKIKDTYQRKGKNRTTQADVRNIMLVGRTRVGKSTIKTLLVDPTVVPEEMTLKSGTKDPLFQSFHVAERNLVLNIIDTPGLFERSTDKAEIRNNAAIMKTIKVCVNREITKYHFICFCVSITNGINQQDIDSLKLLTEFLGKGLSQNSCLIVTRCESLGEEQRKDLRQQLPSDAYFQDIASFFELGIYFSGSINRDDYNLGNKSILRQFKNINNYRATLIDLFSTEIEPFQINEAIIKQILHSDADDEAQRDKRMQLAEEQTAIIAELEKECQSDKPNVTELIKKLNDLNKQEHGLPVTHYQHQEPTEKCPVS